MLNNYNLEEAQKAIKGIASAQPKLLIEINDELQKSDPDVTASRAVARMSACPRGSESDQLAFLRLVSKVSSIPNAVQMLGMKNVQVHLHGLMTEDCPGWREALMLERFWDASEKNARISTYLASTLPTCRATNLHVRPVSGMRIPLLMQRFRITRKPENRRRTGRAMPSSRISAMAPIMRWSASCGETGVVRNDLRAILRHHDFDIFLPRRFGPLVPPRSINFIAEY